MGGDESEGLLALFEGPVLERWVGGWVGSLLEGSGDRGGSNMSCWVFGVGWVGGWVGWLETYVVDVLLNGDVLEAFLKVGNEGPRGHVRGSEIGLFHAAFVVEGEGCWGSGVGGWVGGWVGCVGEIEASSLSGLLALLGAACMLFPTRPFKTLSLHLSSSLLTCVAVPALDQVPVHEDVHLVRIERSHASEGEEEEEEEEDGIGIRGGDKGRLAGGGSTSGGWCAWALCLSCGSALWVGWGVGGVGGVMCITHGGNDT